MAAALRCHIGRSASAVAIAIPRASWLPWGDSRLTLGMLPAVCCPIGQSDSVCRHWITHSHSLISLIGATSNGLSIWKARKTSTLVTNSSSTTAYLDTCSNRVDDTIIKFTRPADRICFPFIIENSSHRDGAIYKNTYLQDYWNDVNVDITDRNETSSESMMCSVGFAEHMLQIFSVTLAQSPISNGSIKVYGYIAVRDGRDGLLNYVLNYSRDDPAVVHQGSLIEMTGPKRGISMCMPVLIEFDMRINNGGQEEDDMQLIDGAIECMFLRPEEPAKYRITGKCSAVDLSLGYIEFAMEAIIEVVFSEVQRDFRLFLSSLVYVMEDYEEILLFHGTIDRSCGLRRFVVAVPLDTDMILKFTVGNDNIEYYRSFKAMQYGIACQQMKFEFGSVSAKVTWSTEFP